MADPESRYTRPLTELVSLAFGPQFVVDEEFGDLGAVTVGIYGSWAARHAGVTGPAPNDVDVMVIGDVPRRDMYEAAERAEQRLGLPVNPSCARGNAESRTRPPTAALSWPNDAARG